jgi:hypothetical protein
MEGWKELVKRMAGSRRIQGPPGLRIVGRVFLALGLAGLLAAAGLAYWENGSGRSATADGVIIGFEYGPVVEFTVQDGSKARLSSSVRSSFWHLGDHLPVAYAADDPTNAAIDGFASRWLLPGLIAILGVVFALLGVAMTVGARLWAARR